MFLIIDEKSDIVGQTHVGKEEIVDAVPQLEGLVYLTEEGDHLIAATDGAGFEMFLDHRQGVEIGQEAAAEV